MDEERRSLLDAGRIEYIAAIKQSVERHWRRPSGTTKGLKVVVRVSQALGGVVTGVDIQRSSGSAGFDESIRRAVLEASPLPTPEEPSLFHRSIVIMFHAED